MLSRFDLVVATKYNYIKDCPEHQIVTLLESNSIEVSPIFYNYWMRSDIFLSKCCQHQICDASYHGLNVFDNLKKVYGLTNEEGNSAHWEYDVAKIRERYGLPIMISCDSYYLPYSKHYNKQHTGTRVIVLDHDVKSELYRVGEAPFLIDDWVNPSFLSFAHGAQQSAKGYYHIPRLPESVVLLMSAEQLSAESAVAASQLTDVLTGATLIDERIEQWCELAIDPHHLTFVFECLMHITAVWTNLKVFIQWLNEVNDKKMNLADYMDEIDQLILSWQRTQMDIMKLHRKQSDDASTVIRLRLRNLVEKENKVIQRFARQYSG